MPSVSKKQHNLMALVATDPSAAKRLGIKQSVGKDFIQADTGKKFGGGGMAKKLFGGKETYSEELKEAKAIKSGKITPEQYAKGEQSEGVHKMACGGKVKKMAGGGVAAMPKKSDMASMNMKSGGAVRGCGAAIKGKTKGRVV